MKMKINWMIMMAAAACITLAGCATDNVRAPQSIRADPLAGGYPQNIVLSGLENSIVINKPIVDSATSDRPLQVTVPLRSVADTTLRVQYRFIFLDSRGKPVRSLGEDWKYQVIAARAEVYLQAGALDLNAADWRLEVRAAQ